MDHKFKVGELIRAKRGVENNYNVTNPSNGYVGVVTDINELDEKGRGKIRASTVYLIDGADNCNYRILAELFEPLPPNEFLPDTFHYFVEIAKGRLRYRGELETALENFPELYDENYISNEKIEAFDKCFEELF